MKISIRNVHKEEDEQVVLECMDMTKDFQDVYNYVQSKGESLVGFKNGHEMFSIPIQNIYYIEAVGALVFAYTKEEVYELKSRLYEMEIILEKKRFVRVSKSIILNMDKLLFLKPAVNGKFSAKLENEEDIIISRQYAPRIKQFILEEM